MNITKSSQRYDNQSRRSSNKSGYSINSKNININNIPYAREYPKVNY